MASSGALPLLSKLQNVNLPTGPQRLHNNLYYILSKGPRGSFPSKTYRMEGVHWPGKPLEALVGHLKQLFALFRSGGDHALGGSQASR